MRKLVNFKNSLLTKESLPVEKDEDISELLHDMDKIGTIFHAYGISAVQLGELKQIFLFRESSLTQFSVAINPKLLNITEIGTTVLEGCLSFPNISIPVSRPFGCTVEFETQSRELVQREFTGMLARVFMHELDHLHGKTIANNKSLLKKELITKKIAKWQKKVDPFGSIYEIY